VSRPSGGLFDAVVVGAGPAGLNAALVLGRTRRNALVVDGGSPRNAASHAMHGFLSRDGLHPAELRRIGRDQLEIYPSVQFMHDAVEDVQTSGQQFSVVVGHGDVIRARKILLAVGIKDALPAIPDFESFYGISAFHCYYCDAWEIRDQAVAVFSGGASGYRTALMLLGWSQDVVFCTNGPSELTGDERSHLAAHGVEVNEQRVVRLEGAGGKLERLVFEDGSTLPRQVLFFHGPVGLDSPLPASIGCALTDQGMIEVDEGGRTSVPGVFAAGDAARRRGQHPSTQVIFAAASGSLAAIALHQELMYEDFGLEPALPRADNTTI
jgi:thioredoxin reductase